jgi:Trk-type K+ transport system membrane component
LINADTVKNTFSTLQRIVFFVVFVEGIGAVLIYVLCADQNAFFAVFHSISAFCNAGFSTMTNNLYEDSVRLNYNFHLVIAILVIIGGFGYNISFNILSIIKYRLHLQFGKYTNMFKTKKAGRINWGLNTALVFWTTVILLVFGTIFFYVLEKDNSLKGLSPYGQFVTSFFGSVTPRTAGFNTIDMTTMLNSTVMIYLLLMWIGASPGSTGGGIKTTTFALATFNLYNQIRGEEKLILMHKTIPVLILNRIMSIISLSLIAIGCGTTLIIVNQPELDPYDVIFECFSAFGTVGLTLGITVKLNTFSKIVIILLMFLGRVSFLNFLLAFFSTFLKRKKNNTIIYPETKIFVN